MEFRERLAELIGPDRGAAARLAEATGASRSLVQAWVKGEKKPSMDYIIALARYFSVTTDDLLCCSLENKKAPVLGISENGREMLALYERLPERDQLLLLGRLQEMTAPLVGGAGEPPAAASSDAKAG